MAARPQRRPGTSADRRPRTAEDQPRCTGPRHPAQQRGRVQSTTAIQPPQLADRATGRRGSELLRRTPLPLRQRLQPDPDRRQPLGPKPVPLQRQPATDRRPPGPGRNPTVGLRQGPEPDQRRTDPQRRGHGPLCRAKRKARGKVHGHCSSGSAGARSPLRLRWRWRRVL